MKLTEQKIRKSRTRYSAWAILTHMEGVKFEDLLSNIFVVSNDEVVKKLITNFEKQLILAHTKPEKFTEGLHEFYKENALFIKKNKLYKEFLAFAYFIFSSLSRKENLNKDVYTCYMDLVIQQFNYFVKHPYVLYGLTTDGKLLTRREPFPYIDMPSLLYSKKDGLGFRSNFRFEDATEILKKYGYNLKSMDELMVLYTHDQILTNMILTMTYFINEHTININPNEMYLVGHGFSVFNEVEPTEKFKNLLREKSNFLPSRGVVGQYQNAKEVKEIFFQELFIEDKVVLLYKVTATNGKEFNGFYDNKLELFFSPWMDTDGEKLYHSTFENFLLENYCSLTTDNDFTTDRSYKVSFVYPSVSKGDSQNQSYKIFDKNNYKEESIQINPFIRRLPMGQTASAEAIYLAKEYGYKLKDGETFVKPFTKSVYRLKD